ncbi:kinase-like domain-containing protein [Xylariaceae sp. FL0662B]|nr:kinase-like domain-containing protein [Xylariaceae sp. FL0662B]
MDSSAEIKYNEPVKIPYFAPENDLPECLPSYESIVSAKEEADLGSEHPNRQVVRIGTHFVAKYGTNVKLIEGENMMFIREFTNIPVPKVYAMYQVDLVDKDTEAKLDELPKINVIIMEYTPGNNLWDLLKHGTLSQVEQDEIAKKLDAQLTEIRSLTADRDIMYGTLGGRPYQIAWWTEQLESKWHGPLSTPTEFSEALFLINLPPDGNIYDVDIDGWHAGFDRLARLQDRDVPKFTHADLVPQNVIIREDGVPVLLDWEKAGWYPAYWECYTANNGGFPGPTMKKWNHMLRWVSNLGNYKDIVRLLDVATTEYWDGRD